MSFAEAESDRDTGISLQSERVAIAIFLVVITSFMFFDILDDWYEGLAFYHIIPEVIIGTFGMGSAAFLFYRFSRGRQAALRRARDEVVQAKKIASEWQARAKAFKQGLTDAIVRQLIEWKLTEAEQEICFLLLKGFSLQEIADLRTTSERTVRQQASVIYRKCGLSGRIELAAFFLEDFLLPMKS